ncbi:ester cyclase [Nonomuraea sp. NPDC046802]|uniref:ester cyclase n=1 Tax=Nonomuraea sp. NPDC046802 TaxID=3154919 RepID=UPI0033E8E2EE
MSIEANKAVARRWLNKETRLEAMDRERYRVVDTPGIPDTDDLETIMRYDEQDDVRKLFRDLTVKVELIADGDKVVIPWCMTGTAVAAFKHVSLGVTIPAGTTITRRGITILTLDNDKVIEERTHEDRLGVLEQLGMSPATR